MTVDEIKELFDLTARKVAEIETEIAENQRKAEENRKKSDEKIAKIRAEAEEDRRKSEAEIAKIRQKTEKYRQDAERHRQDAERYRSQSEKAGRNIRKELGRYTKRVASIAEQYFYHSIKGNPNIGGIRFDKVYRNQKYGNREYDIVLFNGEAIMVVSVKTNLKPEDVWDLAHNALNDFRHDLDRAFDPYRLYGAVAGLTGSDDRDVLRAAEEAGLVVLGQTADSQPTVLNPEVSPKAF